MSRRVVESAFNVSSSFMTVLYVVLLAVVAHEPYDEWGK